MVGTDPSRIVGPSHRERFEAMKLLISYLIGKPPAHVEIEVGGPHGGAIKTEISLERLTTGELRKRWAELTEQTTDDAKPTLP